MKPEFTQPAQAEIVAILKAHPLIRLREKVLRAFVVGSFAKGSANEESDVDILLEVASREGVNALELEDSYRHALRNHFVKNDIRGQMDSVHPQWCGRRVDIYMTYDANLEARPKVELQRVPTLVRSGELERKRELPVDRKDAGTAPPAERSHSDWLRDKLAASASDARVRVPHEEVMAETQVLIDRKRKLRP